MTDLAKARTFVDTHARLLDRRRLAVLLDDGDAGLDGVVAALAAHRNPDGGYGWALEPDLRAPASQPVGAMHAFETLEEIAPATTPLAAELCDWLGAVTLPDGGLPFALPGADAPGSAPWWASADPTRPSLQITSAVCAYAHRVAVHDPAVAGHPWLVRATDWCMAATAALEEPVPTLVLRYVLWLLDAAADVVPAAAGELERLARLVPKSGELAVAGGTESEALRPLDFAPVPDRPLRRHIAAKAIDRHLDRLASEQREDGGWNVDWVASSPAAALEWRGYATVRALALLRANGRLDLPARA